MSIMDDLGIGAGSPDFDKEFYKPTRMSDHTEIIKHAEEVLRIPDQWPEVEKLARAVVEMGKELAGAEAVVGKWSESTLIQAQKERIRELEQQLAELKHALCPDDSITDIPTLLSELADERAVAGNCERILREREKEVAELRYRLQTWDDVHAERHPPQSDEEYARQQASGIGAMVRDEDTHIYEIEADAKRRFLAAIYRGREQEILARRQAKWPNIKRRDA